MSRLLLHLLVRFSVPKQLFAPSKTMADSPTDIDVVFAFKRQNVAKERFYSVVHLPPPPLRASPVCFQSSRHPVAPCYHGRYRDRSAVTPTAQKPHSRAYDSEVDVIPQTARSDSQVNPHRCYIGQSLDTSGLSY